MSVQVDNGVDRALVALLRRAENLQPVLPRIGSLLVEDARLAFRGQRDPWGGAWRPLSATTRLRRASRGTGGRPFKKRGGLSKKAAAIFGSAQALLDTGRLRGSIAFRVAGRAVVIGTNLIYAGTQQFGARRGQYGKRIPWGDVPARPFLPIRPDGRVDLPPGARREIQAVMARHLQLPAD